MPTRTLAILIFDDVEVLDFCGPFEVFSVASRFTDPPAFNVLTVAEKAGPVMTRGGLSVNPHHRLADCPQADLLLVPGGQGTRKEMHNSALIDWIRQASGQAELVMSVCTGALLLAKAGLLDGLASGSYLAINDSVNTSEALEEALRVYEASGAVPYRTRSVEQFAGYFDGLELVEPGVVLVADWRPDPSADRGPEIPQMGGVGRKP